jgi:hypothetical protein
MSESTDPINDVASDVVTIPTNTVYEMLPTGKPHVSFSERSDWVACSYRHKLKFVDKIEIARPGVHMDFGTAIHAACERYLNTRVMDEKIFLKKLHELWKLNVDKFPNDYTVEAFKQFAKEGLAILPEVPGWLEENFPEWELIDAEHMLYEPIEGQSQAFKGFIDGVISCKGPKGKTLIWLLDWKSCSWGWPSEKKGDPNVCSQLVLYKNYWSVKTDTDPKDVRCGFVLLKRTAKPGKHCELVTTSAGEVTTQRSLKVINNMVVSIKRGIALKNRSSCKWCDYYATPHCT